MNAPSVFALLLAAQSPKADTVPPAAVIEQPFVARNGAVELKGTLSLPASATGRITVALIVAGSGPTDRNGNNRAGLRTNTYAQMAWRLGERGLAVLRYDKRAIGAGPESGLSQWTIDDYARDAHALADTLARDPRFSRVVLVGHSEGALLAIMAARDGAPVAGVASVAGMGRPMGAVLHEQLARQIDSTTLARFDVAMTAFLKGETPSDVPQGLGMFFVPVNRAFLASVYTLDPTAVMRAVRQPTLILQGAHDAQITVRDAELLHAAKPDARLVVLPKANHLLKEAPNATLAAQGATYSDPTLPVMPDAVIALADWIAGLR